MSNDLAKRAVACKHWRWKSGMRTTCGILSGGDDWVTFGYDHKDMVILNDGGRWLPDLTDAATLGCLLALVREAWGDDGICPDFNKMRWTILTWDCCAIGDGSTEAEALVAALEAAPC